MLFNQYMKPSFMIIGGVKCGTSSLYRYLNQHPHILPCKIKEPRIFHYKNVFKTMYKLPWYYRLYPKKKFTGTIIADWVTLTNEEKFKHTSFKKEKKSGVEYITGEASADTFARAYPRLVKTLFPHIKLIVLLRNPTKRFISDYKMHIRFANDGRKGFQSTDLRTFIAEQINSFEKGNFRNALAQGIYVKHLKNWLKIFDKNKLYISKTENLADPESAQNELNHIYRFLGLDEYSLDEKWGRFNVSKKDIEVADELKRLNEFYQPYNEVLAEQFNIYFE